MVKLFKIETDKIVSAKYMFSAVDYNNNSVTSALTSWYSDLSSLTNGSKMFYKCNKLETFYAKLGELAYGDGMFNGCSGLKTVSSGAGDMFNKLIDGQYMFCECSSLSDFEHDLPKLTNGSHMFSLSNITSFYGNLSSLADGNGMFENCYKLEKFSNDEGETHLSKLTNGNNMFYCCTSLSTFYGNLSSLVTGDEMFTGCKLDSDSVETILKTIPSTNSGYLTISMDESGCRKAAEMMSLTSGTIPTYTNGGGLDVVYKNWKLYLTSGYGEDFVITSGSGSGDGIDMSSFAIVEGSQYIPDASDWNTGVFIANKLYEVITDVIDETAYTTIASGSDIELGTKYLGCKNIGEIKAVDANYLTTDIVDGVWTQSLADLEEGGNDDDLSLFYLNKNIVTFKSDLSSLASGYMMFWCCENLTTFDADLSSLTNGDAMFGYCSSLTTFDVDLSSLDNGDAMFVYCSSLTTFNSDLSSLTRGEGMFQGCKLDATSVQNIADTINTPARKGKIHIGIGNTTPNEQEEEAFNTIASRNWTVYVNGSSSSNIWNPTATTPIDGEQTTTPIPFWAKPVPATEETASYVDLEGNFYNVLGALFIYGDDLSTYGMFVSEEDAAANMRLTKLERN